ncbi:MAG: cytochrome c biogenesis protein CcdA, partial [Smithella sp.]
MLVDLFTSLTAALTQSPEIAIAAAFAWGVLSVILSPCHIACIPLIVGFIDGQGNISTGRAFVLSLLFGLGILITIGLIGLITALAGRMMGDIGGYGNYLVAVVFFAIGLNLLGILSLPFMEGGANPNYKRKGFLAAFILGLIFGVALGPCTFAYMATMLGVVFSMAS